MDAWDRHHIAELLLQAAEIALRHYARPERRVKSDGSIVTVADEEIEAFLTDALADPCAGRYLVGEETVAELSEADVQAALRHQAYIVDPIDGTAPYAYHLPLWGISIGYAASGRLQEGAVYLPVTGELFCTDAEGAWFASGASAGTWAWHQLKGEHPGYWQSGIIAISQSQARRGRFAWKNPVHALACAVVPLCYLTLNRYIAYYGTLKLWDVAGALPLLQRLGFAARTLDGVDLSPELDESWLDLAADSPRRWRVRGTTVFAPPQLVEQLRQDAIEARG